MVSGGGEMGGSGTRKGERVDGGGEIIPGAKLSSPEFLLLLLLLLF